MKPQRQKELRNKTHTNICLTQKYSVPVKIDYTE